MKILKKVLIIMFIIILVMLEDMNQQLDILEQTYHVQIVQMPVTNVVDPIEIVMACIIQTILIKQV